MAKIRFQAMLLSGAPLVFLILLTVLSALLVDRAQRVSQQSSTATSSLTASDALQDAIGAESRAAESYTANRSASARADYRRAAAQFPVLERELLQTASPGAAQRRAALRYLAEVRDAVAVIDRYMRLEEAGHSAQARAYAASPHVRQLGSRLTVAKAAFDQQTRAIAMRRFDLFSKGLRAMLAWILVACVAGIVATIIATTSFGMRIVRRLEILASNVRRLGAGESVETLRGNDELAILDRLYLEITHRLRDALRQKDELLNAYEREHHVASTLQRALLPQELPAIPGVRIDAAYVPAAKSAEIGGDWYDVFALSDRVLAVGVGDVAGHDLQAATLMGAVRQAIRVAAHEDADPATVLRRVNRTLCADDQHRMVTAFFGVLDLADGMLRYATAGHPPPFVVTPDRDIRLLEGSGVALGINRRFDFTTMEARLELGTAIVLYTDGMVEVDRDYDRGLAALESAVAAEAFSAGGNIAQQIQERVFAQVRPTDDSALLFIAITDLEAAQSVTWRQAWTFDAKDEAAAHRVKRALLWNLGERAMPTSDFAAAETIIGELISNVARHTPGLAEAIVEFNENGAELVVCDRGRAFKSTGEHAPDPLAESGRGLFLVRSLARRFEVVHTVEGNRVTVLLPVAISTPINITAA